MARGVTFVTRRLTDPDKQGKCPHVATTDDVREAGSEMIGIETGTIRGTLVEVVAGEVDPEVH